LNALLASQVHDGPLKILDCACGSDANFGFASRVHHVVASDLSPEAVARAKREASAVAWRFHFTFGHDFTGGD